jgi:predicted secreted protein
VNLLTIVAVYFIVWWLVLFVVLPWGMRTQEEEGEVVLGTTASAPARPRIVRTVIVTTIVATIVVGLFWLAVDVYGLSVWTISDWFDLRQ